MASDPDRATRERILDSAGRLFAEQGIRTTTVKEICDAADANVAAVNYYFGSKDRLVEEVWESTLGSMQRLHGRRGVEDLPPLARLEALVRSHLRSVMDDGPGGRFPKIVFRALSEFDREEVEALFERHLAPRMNTLLDTVREVLGPQASDLQVRSCALAIHSPCVHLNIARNKGQGPMFRGAGVELDADVVIDTITEFILGGILAMSRGLPSSPANGEEDSA